MLFAERILKKLGNFGESFTLDGITYQGMFKVLDNGTMRIYLDDVEMMGVTHPALLLVTGPDVPISLTDTITRDGRTYCVLKVATQRVAGDAVATIAILN